MASRRSASNCSPIRTCRSTAVRAVPFKGTCALTEFKVEAMDAKHTTNKVKVKIGRATADFEQPERPLEPNFDDKTTNSRVTGPIQNSPSTATTRRPGASTPDPGRRNQARNAVFVPTSRSAFGRHDPGASFTQQNHGGWNSDDHMNNNLGRFRISATKAEGGAKADPLPRKVREIFRTPREQRTPVQVATVFSYWRTTVADWKDANEKIEALWKEYPEGATAMTLLARATPRETHVLRRGDWLKPQDAVTPGVPGFLHALPKDADGSRLTFARWIADRKSPTTARVFVNRVWQTYFGTGLVGTSEDFGMQSDAPSHPELLDWLACEFMDNGWSVKSLHRSRSSPRRPIANLQRSRRNFTPRILTTVCSRADRASASKAKSCATSRWRRADF